MTEPELRFDAAGLIPAVVQEAVTGEVLMVAWMDRAALEATRTTGTTHFWSRSRQAPWRKGETSGNVQRVHALWADCDGDVLLVQVHQHGVACHTGHRTCFFTRDAGGRPAAFDEAEAVPHVLARVEQVIAARKSAPAPGSYVADLLAEGEAAGVHRNYKCRTRTPWYSVRRQLPPPELLLGYLMKRRPRMSANEAGAHSTNNVHRLYLKSGRPDRVAAAAYSAPARLSIELTGRVSAAGALKIEPGDASKILLPRTASAGRPGGITKEDVVRWTGRGDRDDLIVDRIEQSGTAERLSSRDENDLRDRGVSEDVIRAMKDAARR